MPILYIPGDAVSRRALRLEADAQSERTLGKAKHGEAQPFDQCKMMICHHPNSI